MNDIAAARYSRQLPIPIIGSEGQRLLSNATVLVVGCGGLGSTLLYALAGAGVGTLRFADGDVVDASNLNRQFLHTVDDIGKNKAVSAKEKLARFNPDIRLEPFADFITQENAAALLDGCDMAALAVDSIPTRLVLNHALLRANITFVDGGVDGLSGTLLPVVPGQTACLACLYGGAPASERTPSSFAPVVSVVSALEAQIVLLTLLGQPNPLLGKLLVFDGTRMTFDTLPLLRRPNCKICGA